MLINEAHDVLTQVIAKASPDDTRRAVKIYPTLPLPDKTIAKSKASTIAFSAFGHRAIDLALISGGQTSKSLSKNAGYTDHYDHRTVEVTVENLMLALLAKPSLKPEEFSMLVAPWRDYLPAELTSTDGCGVEAPPAPTHSPKIESLTVRRQRKREEARETKKREKQERADARAIARAEKKSKKSVGRVMDLVGEITGKTKVAADPEFVKSKSVPVVVDPLAQARAQAINGVQVRVAYDSPSSGHGRPRKERWWRLVVPPPSNAQFVKEKFESEDAARSYAEERGWEIIGVVYFGVSQKERK